MNVKDFLGSALSHVLNKNFELTLTSAKSALNIVNLVINGVAMSVMTDSRYLVTTAILYVKK